MEYQLFIYIFVLFVTFTPRLFFSKPIPYINIIHALLFTIILYFTYYLVKGKITEGYEYNLTVDGSNNFENVVDSIFQPDEPHKVNINVVNKHNGLARRKLKEAKIQPYEPAFPYIEKPDPIPRLIIPETIEQQQELEQEQEKWGERTFAEPEQPVFLPPDPKEAICEKPEKSPDPIMPALPPPPPPPTPIHLYKFNSNGSKTAMDTNDKQNIENKNGSLVGNHIKIEDGALTFSMRSIYSKSYLDLPVNITEGSKIVTIETRVSTLDLNKGWTRIFQFGKDGNNDSFFLYRWNYDDINYGNIAFNVNSSSGESLVLANTNTKFDSLNQAHIVLVLNGETKDVKIYINRVLIVHSVAPFDLTPIINNTRRNYLGRSLENGDVGFHGKIHEFAVWDIELTQELVNDRFNSWKRESGIIPETITEGEIVSPSNGSFLNWDNQEALSLFVDGQKDNAGGPTYTIFDNKDMTDKNGVITFTATVDTTVKGIFIGMGEQGRTGFNIGQDHNHPLYYGGAGGGGQSGERLNFNLQRGQTFTVQFDDKNGYSILKTPQKEIKLKVGSSNKGGKGYVQNQQGGNGQPSTGPDVSDIIKTSTKADGTRIFQTQYGTAVIPTKFGGGGGGGTGYHNYKNFGKRAGWGGAGTGYPSGTVQQSEPIRDLRNYGAGGGGTNAPTYNNTPGQRRNSAPSGYGGISGLILVTELQAPSPGTKVELDMQRSTEECALNQSYGLLSDNILWIKDKCDGIFNVNNNVFGCKGSDNYSLCIFKK